MYKSLAVLSLLAAGVCCQQLTNIDDDLKLLIESIFNDSISNPGQATTSPPTTSSTPYIRPSTLVPSTPSKDKLIPCQTESGQEGVCVRYYQCSKNASIIVDGLDLIDMRNSDGPCPSSFLKCCTHPLDTPRLPPTSSPRYSCGVRNIKGVGFLTTGDINNESKFGEFPYMVAIFNKDKESNGLKLNTYVGGGSLIHPSIVLTAAHTVASTPQLLIRAGEWDTKSKNELFLYQERDVKEVVMHKDFNGGNLFNDIALLFLAKPVQLAEHIGVACLPLPGERAEHSERCQTSGWGKKSFDEQLYQNILKRTEIPVVDHDKCQEQLRNTRLGWFFELHSSFMCAGGEPGKDACIGDGGSPLVCPLKNVRDRYVQYGIVAWGIGCGEVDVPGVYVDVGNLRSWIDDKVIARGYDPKVYTY